MNQRNYTAEEFFSIGRGIVTLCGSTKFFEECMEINRRLTFKRWIVLMCGSWGHSYHKDVESGLSDEDYFMIKELHLDKILLSNAIVVVSDKTGYYGESTSRELNFNDEFCNLPVFYFNGEELTGNTIVEPIDFLSLRLSC